MKRINLKKVTDEELNAVIRQEEGRATARTLTAKEIRKVCSKVEGICPTKKALNGVSIHYTAAEYFSNSYNHKPYSTHFEAVYKNNVWYITEIYRDVCPGGKNNTLVTWTDEAKQAILDSIERLYV